MLGPVRLIPTMPEVGRRFYTAETAIEVLDLLDEASDGGSNSLRQWTRSQPIRTVARLPIRFPLHTTRSAFSYQKIASKSRDLRRLGMTDSAIARALGVSDKTVAKAIHWLSRRRRS